LGLLTDAFNQMLTRIQEQTVALAESEERLRLALEASRTGIWDWNIKANRVAWDEHTDDLFGLKHGIFGGTYEHFLDLVHPQDRLAVSSSITRALEQKAQFTIEFRVSWPDASLHYVGMRGQAFYDATSQPTRMTGVIVDITERKRAEELRSLLVAIIDSTDDAIIGKDLSGKILSWNTGAERMFGYTAREILGQPITRIVSPDRPEEEPSILREAREGVIRHYETVRVRKDRQPIEVSLTVSPIKAIGARSSAFRQFPAISPSVVARNSPSNDRPQSCGNKPRCSTWPISWRVI